MGKPIDNVLAMIDRLPARCRLPGTDPHDAQLDCRVGGGGSEHYRTIEAPEFSIDPQKKIIPTLDKLLRKRNIGSYDDYGFTVETCCE